MLLRSTLLALTFLAAPSLAHAQPHCRKGIPCGGSCISARKTCRVGPAPTRTAPLALVAPSDTATVRPRASGGGGPYQRGPRGGCYTITASGRKRYVDHARCG